MQRFHCISFHMDTTITPVSQKEFKLLPLMNVMWSLQSHHPQPVYIAAIGPDSYLCYFYNVCQGLRVFISGSCEIKPDLLQSVIRHFLSQLSCTCWWTGVSSLRVIIVHQYSVRILMALGCYYSLSLCGMTGCIWTRHGMCMLSASQLANAS